jgi:phospholipase C
MNHRLIALALAGTVANAPLVHAGETATPIKHVVVIFQENVSFDHYFGTYPVAANPAGEPAFHARPGTPSVNGLSGSLLSSNPNLNPANGTGASNPFRLDRSQAATADQDHAYTPEQMAVDGGLMDLFPKSVGAGGPPPDAPPNAVTTTGLTMGYYDGNTVTAFWNYAQNFAMNDNSYGTTFGPSTPGALNLISGQTNGITATLNGTGDEVDGSNGSLTMIGDADPLGDVCASPTRAQASMAGQNVGNLLSAAHVTWGWFAGGFSLTRVNSNGTTGCLRSSTSPLTTTIADYIPHHAPFQYYPSTANPTHARPSSLAMVGHEGDGANHQYDLDDFFAAIKMGNFPAVSFLKAISIQDGHAGYSDPLDEQHFVVKVVNFLQELPEWKDTAVIIAYDDSDGWYDHQMAPVVNQSTSLADALTGPGACGDGSNALPGTGTTTHAQGRCGYGPRLPLLVISQWAKENFVDGTLTDQSSVLRFIEDNWLGGQRIGQGSFDALAGSLDNMFDFKHRRQSLLFLDARTGKPLQ